MNENLPPEQNESTYNPVMTPPTPAPEPVAENVVAGIVGAFLFSLVGGVVWFLLYQLGVLASISGIIGVVCAIKGYAVFGKRESVKGVVIASVIAFLVMVLAWYLCLSYDVYQAYQEWFANGEVDFTLTFPESVLNAHLFLSEGEIAVAYFKDLVIGLAFCALGAFGSIKNALAKAKNG